MSRGSLWSVTLTIDGGGAFDQEQDVKRARDNVLGLCTSVALTTLTVYVDGVEVETVGFVPANVWTPIRFPLVLPGGPGRRRWPAVRFVGTCAPGANPLVTLALE